MFYVSITVYPKCSGETNLVLTPICVLVKLLNSSTTAANSTKVRKTKCWGLRVCFKNTRDLLKDAKNNAKVNVLDATHAIA